jgi:6-phosphogluconolactonase/glucosamine-6-phosphate isomerase/deaminase
MQLLIYPIEDVLEKASDAVNAMLEREFGGPVLFLLSGGSSLALLERIRAELLGPHITIMMSDERLSTDSNVNNFAQMTATPFYRNAVERSCAFIDTRVKEKETVAELGVRMHDALRDWRKANPSGRVVMTQGMGPDGHTCGIMPFPSDEKRFKELFETEGLWAVGYDASGKSDFPLRATVTISLLKNGVDESVAYAVGSAKKSALRRASAGDIEHWKTPAAVMREMKKVTLFTDQHI